MRLSTFTILIGILALVACQRTGTYNFQTQLIPGNATASISTFQQDNSWYLVIHKNALGKDYFLSAALLDSQGAPTSEGLQGRIVQFEQRGKSLFMFETTSGNIVTDEIPTKIFLTQFPIIAELNNYIIFNFNDGMRTFYAAKSFLSESSDSTYDIDARFRTISLSGSYIESTELLDENTLYIKQVGQWRDAKGGMQVNELHYALRPYEPNPNFKSKQVHDEKYVGYFTTPAYFEKYTGNNVVNIAKWDTSRPITYYISANTPKKHWQAITDGILYWNAIFGKNVLRVEVAPDNIRAPHPSYNLIQWIRWDNAGYAYADAATDPSSGEIRNANVYLMSSWAITNKKSIRKLLAQLKNLDEQPASSSTTLCQKQLNHLTYAQATLTQLLQVGLSDEALERASNDILRAVVAHEVGHTLGLRHNFAGSTYTTWTAKDRKTAFLNYILRDELSAYIESGSLMDYHDLQTDMLIGRRIREFSQTHHLDNHFGEHDKEAIRFSYTDAKRANKTLPFCTDGDSLIYDDCRQFDLGNLPIVEDSDVIASQPANMAAYFIEHYVALAQTLGADIEDFKLQAPNPQGYANLILKPFKRQLKWLSTKAKAINIGDKHGDDAQFAWVREQINAIGGIKTIFQYMPPFSDEHAFINQVKNELDNYLATFQETTLGDERFNDEELTLIKEKAQSFFTIVDELVVVGMLDAMTKAKFEEPSTQAQIEEILYQIAIAFILQQTPEPSIIATQDKTYTLPKFRYTLEQRILATKLLAASLGTWPDWSYTSRLEAKSKVTETIEQAVELPMKQITAKDLPRPIRQWYLEQKSVLDSLT